KKAGLSARVVTAPQLPLIALLLARIVAALLAVLARNLVGAVEALRPVGVMAPRVAVLLAFAAGARSRRLAFVVRAGGGYTGRLRRRRLALLHALVHRRGRVHVGRLLVRLHRAVGGLAARGARLRIDAHPGADVRARVDVAIGDAHVRAHAHVRVHVCTGPARACGLIGLSSLSRLAGRRALRHARGRADVGRAL